MKYNRILTQQTLKELSKSISKTADLFDPDKPCGIECKKIAVEKYADKFGVYHMDINIKVSLVDESLEIGEILERFK